MKFRVKRYKIANSRLAMKIKLIFILTLITSIAFAQKQEAGISLIVDGKSDYSIVLPQHASKEEIRAADFLKEHLQKISGCSLPVIYAENPASGNFIMISKSLQIACDDGFRIATAGNKLIIEGGRNKGCIYGVTELLGKFMGVRYYSPEYVVIPETKDITLPVIQLQDSSPNTYRNVHGEFTDNQNYKEFHRLNDISELFADNFYVHTFNKLVPWKENFESHPEYFAWINGKRRIDQLCLSNPDVLQMVVAKLEQEMALQPDKKFWSVSQNDNFSYCRCDQCKEIIEEEGSPSGPVIRFVNQVAEKFPEKVISTLAYQYSRKAPVKTKPRQNVQVMLCTIELNRSLPIATDPSSASFLKDLEEWGKICNHIYLWDYTVDFAHSISPFPNLHTLQPNIQLFVKNNVREHFQQSNTGVGHEFSELKSYLLAKLLWNPNADVTEIIREFTDGFYGPAGLWIRKYIYQLQTEILKTGEWLDIYGPPTNHQHTFLSSENISDYNRFFDEAEQAVADKPEYLLHVRTARMPLQYAIFEIGKSDMFGSRGWYTEKDGDFVPVQQMTEMLESFYKTSQEAKSRPVNESGLTTEAYYQSTKRFIDVQVRGNVAFRKKVTAAPVPSEKYSDGDLSLLTNGVRGANDFKVHWLGWESKDFSLMLDLDTLVEASVVEISMLWDPKSWILHPVSVSCFVSDNGKDFKLLEEQIVVGDQQYEEVNRTFTFNTQGMKYRYVRFDIQGSLHLFDWHPSAGGGSWVFADEIVVRQIPAN